MISLVGRRVKQSLICLLASISLTCTAAAQERRPGGCGVTALVNALRGAATLQRGVKKERLTRANAMGKQLRAGDRLQVDAGASLVILFCGSRELKEITQRPPKWYTVPNVPRDREDPLFSGYSDRTPLGRSYGLSGLIFSPPSGGVVMPKSFVIRWEPFQFSSPVTLKLTRDGSDEALWQQSDVDSTSGNYTSDILRDLLQRIRGRSPEAALRLRLTGGRIISSSVVFHLLPVESEDALSNELREADRAEGFLRPLGRAIALTRSRLYLDAAQEYERALASSPDSVDLILATILVQCRAGDIERTTTLFKRLPHGHPARNKDCWTALPIR